MFCIHKWLPNGEGDVLFKHEEEGAPLAWIKSRHPLFVGLVVRSARRNQACVLVWKDAVQMSTGLGWPHNAPVLRVVRDRPPGRGRHAPEFSDWFDREYWHVHAIALDRVLRGRAGSYLANGRGARPCRCYSGGPAAAGTCQGQEGCWKDTACAITVEVAEAAMRGDAAEKITEATREVNTGKDDWEVW